MPEHPVAPDPVTIRIQHDEADAEFRRALPILVTPDWAMPEFERAEHPLAVIGRLLQLYADEAGEDRPRMIYLGRDLERKFRR